MQQDRLKSKTISEAVFEKLHASILEGVLRPGDRLQPERVLAQELGVSRTSVREALQRLQVLGLVEHRQGGGTYVSETAATPWTDPLVQMLENRPEAIYDLIEFRQALESIAAHYAAMRATEADREILRRRLAAIQKAHQEGDSSGEADADADFHLSIADAAHNPVLAYVMQGVFQALRKGIASSRQRLFARKGAREALYGQHQALFEAVAEGKAKEARQAVSEHLEFVKTRLEEIQRETAWEDESLRRLSVLGGPELPEPKGSPT